MPSVADHDAHHALTRSKSAYKGEAPRIREIDIKITLAVRFPDLSEEEIDSILTMMRQRRTLGTSTRDGLGSTSKFRGLAPWQERRAREFIGANMVRGISVDEIAMMCAYSRCHFSRAFKASTGVTPHQYLLNLKIEKSKSLLLNENHNICDIACECGFSDSSHFSKVFSRLVGFTPSYWRRMQFGFR